MLAVPVEVALGWIIAVSMIGVSVQHRACHAGRGGAGSAHCYSAQHPGWAYPVVEATLGVLVGLAVLDKVAHNVPVGHCACRAGQGSAWPAPWRGVLFFVLVKAALIQLLGAASGVPVRCPYRSRRHLADSFLRCLASWSCAELAVLVKVALGQIIVTVLIVPVICAMPVETALNLPVGIADPDEAVFDVPVGCCT